jgi:hypothetical protein
LRQGSIQNLAILPVGAVPAHTHTRSPIPFFLAVVVERPLARPTVVGGPGGVAALKKEIARSVVADDEYDIALVVAFLCGQLPKIDAAKPVFGNC